MKIVDINKQIGGRIRIARISRNLSQDNLAEDLGISVSAYSNMERGVVEITVSRIIQVADILKLNWHFLLGIKVESEMDFEKEIRILKGEIGKLKKKAK